MKTLFLLLLLLLVVTAVVAWTTIPREVLLEPLYEEPYVIVYGRQRCSLTRNCLQYLQRAGVDPIFEDVDRQDVSDELHDRMRKSGLDTGRYGLPVVDVKPGYLSGRHLTWSLGCIRNTVSERRQS